MSEVKRVLVTGGSRGIGRACVAEFVKRGCRVAFIYEKNHEAASATERGLGATAICCDISSSKCVTAAVRRAEEILGGIDVLVNNSAVSYIGTFDSMTDTELQRVMSVNLMGAMLVSRETVKRMISQKYGRIINIGSMWGKTGASCEVAYSASKAGLRGFTMALAKELGPSGITVNCVEPGVINTDMNSCLDGSILDALREETPLCT